MGFLGELHHANVCQHFRDCLGTAQPNWPTAQRLEIAPCCHLPRPEGPTLPRDRPPVSYPSELPLATAPVFVHRCPPGVLRECNFVFHKLQLIQQTPKQKAMMGTDLSF